MKERKNAFGKRASKILKYFLFNFKILKKFPFNFP